MDGEYLKFIMPMRHITKEMLLDAVERKVPLFEDGDEFGDDVARILFSHQPLGCKADFRVNRKLLVSNIVPKKNWHEDRTAPLRFVTKCNCCGKPLRFSMQKSAMTTRTDLLRLCIPRFQELHSSKIRYFVSEEHWFEYLDLIDSILCSDCIRQKREEFEQFLESYLAGDKFTFWNEYFLLRDNDSCSPEIRRRKAIFNVLVGCVGYDLNYKLEFIQCKITGDYYFHDGSSMTSKEYDKRRSSSYKPNRNMDQTKVPVSTALSNTDVFMQRYCRPTDVNATIDDLQQILNADNLNERQLQDNLRAMLYKDFVKTLYWKSIVLRRKYIDGMICTKCGAKNNLEVHHLTYEHHGDERHHFEDLITLCNGCHEKLHKEVEDI